MKKCWKALKQFLVFEQLLQEDLTCVNQTSCNHAVSASLTAKTIENFVQLFAPNSTALNSAATCHSAGCASPLLLALWCSCFKVSPFSCGVSIIFFHPFEQQISSKGTATCLWSLAVAAPNFALNDVDMFAPFLHLKNKRDYSRYLAEGREKMFLFMCQVSCKTWWILWNCQI